MPETAYLRRSFQMRRNLDVESYHRFQSTAEFCKLGAGTPARGKDAHFMILHATAKFTPRGSAGQFIAANVTPAIEDGVAAIGERILATAQFIAPEDTGELRDSGKVVVIRTDKTATAHVVFDSGHAGYVEYGTGIRGAASEGAGPYAYDPNWPGMPAQPYLRPALDEERANAVSELAGAIQVRLHE
jgi:hypothetical protein